MDSSSLIEEGLGDAMSPNELVITVGDKLICSCLEDARITGQELSWQPVCAEVLLLKGLTLFVMQGIPVSVHKSQ